MNISHTDCTSQSFNGGLSRQTIHCGKNEYCNITCSGSKCIRTTFYIYQYPTIIRCHGFKACYKANIISTNTSSLQLDVGSVGSDYEAFAGGYISAQNVGSLSINCRKNKGLLYCFFWCIHMYLLCIMFLQPVIKPI